LPAGSHLINVGRGGTIVDDDLLALLDTGHIASATLDVFEIEPLAAEHRYWHHARVIVTPHLAGPTPREPAAQQIAAAIAALERGAEVTQLADMSIGGEVIDSSGPGLSARYAFNCLPKRA